MIVNNPKVSKSIRIFYLAINVLLIILMVLFIFLIILTPIALMGLAVLVVLALVEAVILSLYISLHRTRYIITKDKVIIKTSKLIGGVKEILIKDIEHIERTLIPFGLRLFGASFHGGYYYIPALGKAFLAITNFKDGLLIKAKNGNYIITPKNPKEFENEIRKRLVT